MITTLNVREYAAVLLGPGPDDSDPIGSVEPHKIQWLTKRLRGEAKPRLPGYKVARQWRATRADVEKAIELLRPTPPGPVLPDTSSLTKTTRRRLHEP